MARRNEHTREQIQELALVAADQIIQNGGLTSLTTRRVAQDIGYTVGTLYLVFENLDDLVSQVNVRTLQRLSTRLTESTAGTQVDAEKLEILVSTFVEFLRAAPYHWSCVVEHHYFSGSAYAGRTSEQMDVIVQSFVSALGQIMTQRGSLEHEDAARGLWSGIQGVYLFDPHARLGGEPSKQRIWDFVYTYLQGLSVNRRGQSSGSFKMDRGICTERRLSYSGARASELS